MVPLSRSFNQWPESPDFFSSKKEIIKMLRQIYFGHAVKQYVIKSIDKMARKKIIGRVYLVLISHIWTKFISSVYLFCFPILY